MSLSALNVALDGALISGVGYVGGLAVLLCNMELFLLTLPAPPQCPSPPTALTN